MGPTDGSGRASAKAAIYNLNRISRRPLATGGSLDRTRLGARGRSLASRVPSCCHGTRVGSAGACALLEKLSAAARQELHLGLLRPRRRGNWCGCHGQPRRGAGMRRRRSPQLGGATGCGGPALVQHTPEQEQTCWPSRARRCAVPGGLRAQLGPADEHGGESGARLLAGLLEQLARCRLVGLSGAWRPDACDREPLGAGLGTPGAGGPAWWPRRRTTFYGS